MKIKKLTTEFGAAWEEAQPVRISLGDASILVYVKDGTDLVVRTEGSDWKVQSSGSDCRLTVIG